MKRTTSRANGFNKYFDDPQLAMNMATSLIKANHEAEKNLSPEELLKRKEERKIAQEKRHVIACVNAGKCPFCQGKLVRGKKDKKNDYKRTWTCSKCESVCIL